MTYKTKSFRREKGFEVWWLDFRDEVKTRWCNFWDFKYKKERKLRKGLLKAGEMEKIPVDKLVKKDIKNLAYNPSTSHSMKYVKTKSGAVVVTPASIREIKDTYEGAELVEARFKTREEFDPKD